MKAKLLSCVLTIVLLACRPSSKDAELISTSAHKVFAIEESERNHFTAANQVDTLLVQTEHSLVYWKGEKLTKSHDGSIAIDQAYLLYQKGELIGGKFVLDMEQIKVLDLQGEDKARLEGKLKGKAFFKVDQYPKSELEILKEDSGRIEANLKILGKTKTISFPFKIVDRGEEFELTAHFNIDRTDWGVIYGSGTFLDLAKDKAISDYISFDIKLRAKK